MSVVFVTISTLEARDVMAKSKRRDPYSYATMIQPRNSRLGYMAPRAPSLDIGSSLVVAIADKGGASEERVDDICGLDVVMAKLRCTLADDIPPISRLFQNFRFKFPATALGGCVQPTFQPLASPPATSAALYAEVVQGEFWM